MWRNLPHVENVISQANYTSSSQVGFVGVELNYHL